MRDPYRCSEAIWSKDISGSSEQVLRLINIDADGITARVDCSIWQKSSPRDDAEQCQKNIFLEAVRGNNGVLLHFSSIFGD